MSLIWDGNDGRVTLAGARELDTYAAHRLCEEQARPAGSWELPPRSPSQALALIDEAQGLFTLAQEELERAERAQADAAWCWRWSLRVALLTAAGLGFAMNGAAETLAATPDLWHLLGVLGWALPAAGLWTMARACVRRWGA